MDLTFSEDQLSMGLRYLCDAEKGAKKSRFHADFGDK